MSKKIKGPVDEKQLWHGTSKESSEAICRQNFDFRISGSNVGTLYGQGSYFANNANYSDKYSRPESNIRRMFLVRVLVGSFVKGKPEYKRPPPKDPHEPLGDLHDACVDNELNPSIYVVFDKSQAYPEYLIEYKRSSDPDSPARLPASVPKASTVRTSTSGYSKSQAKASAAVGPSMSSVNTSYMSKTYSDPLAASSGSRYSASSSPSASSQSSMSSDYTSNTTRATQPAQGLGATGVARTSANNTSASASGSNGSYSPYTSQTSRSSNTTRITQQADQGFDALAAARASVNPSYNSASASWSSDRYSGSTSRSSDPLGASSQTSASSYDPFAWACAGFVTEGCWIKIVCVQVERSERSVLTAWGPGAAQGPLVGSRGNASSGVQGAEPPEAPGFSGFLRPQNASPRIVFLSFLRQVFLQNHLI